MAMSVIQGGCGMPFLHKSMYQYIVNGEKNACILVEELPEGQVHCICNKVKCQMYIMYIVLHYSLMKLIVMRSCEICFQLRNLDHF